MNGPRGRGEKLLDELAAASDRAEAIRVRHEIPPRIDGFGNAHIIGTPLPAAVRDAWWAELCEADDERQAIADRVQAYFEGPDSSVEEKAMWLLAARHWKYRRRR
jgi:hypothetical protein